MSCADFINSNELQIKNKVIENGYSFFTECEGVEPHIFVAVIDLNRDEFEINITHSPVVGTIQEEKTEDGEDSAYFGLFGHKLTTIVNHSNREDALIALNGFTWKGGFGGMTPELQFGIPASSMFSRGIERGLTQNEEIQIGFSERNEQGTKVASIVQSEGMIGIGETFRNSLISSTTSYLVDGENLNNSDVPFEYKRWSGIGVGKKWGKDVLVLLSSSSSYLKLFKTHNDFVEVFKSLGVDNAMRLDGNSAAAMTYKGEHLNKLPLRLRYFSHANYGESRKILYALTVTKKPPLSKPQFENVSITPEITFNETVDLTGTVTSNRNITEIPITTTKPDGQVLVTLFELNDDSIDLSELGFDLEGETKQVGTYNISIVAKDSVGAESPEYLTVEVLPKIISMTPIPTEQEAGKSFKVLIEGEKMPNTMVMQLGTDNSPCSAVYINEGNAEFSCDTYRSGNFRYVLYNKQDGALLKEQFINITEPPAQTECTPNETQTRTCSITNGEGEQSRSCMADGSDWNNYGNCEVTDCLNGYEQSGNTCVAEDNPEPEIGVPDDVQVGVSDVAPSIGVAWTPVSNADSYEIQLVDEDGSDDRTVTATDNEIILNNLSENNDYKLRVRAIVNGQQGGYTDYVSFSIGEYGNNGYCALIHFTNSTLSQDLRKDDKDFVNGITQVQELQNFLNEIGHNTGTPDGIFGDLTVAGVKSYQQANNLSADGIVGSNTRASINAYCD